MHFDPQKLYPASDPTVTEIIPYSTGASWRCEGKGPSYLKLSGGRVFYRGSELNAWLESRTVRPKTAAA